MEPVACSPEAPPPRDFGGEHASEQWASYRSQAKGRCNEARILRSFLERQNVGKDHV